MYIYYKIYKSMRRGRIHGEKNMRNSRTKTQTKLRNYIKLTAGALLLAITFVLVFAGTLSGAFGIESDLQQNGIIQSNVASAANTPAGNTEFTSGGHEGMTLNNAATYKYFNVLDNYVLGMYSDNGDPLNYAYWVYYNTGTSQNKNGINIEGGNGKASIPWNITLSGQIYKAFKNGAITTVTFKTTSYSGGNTDPRALSVFSSNAYGSFDSDLTYSNSDIIATTGKKDAFTLEHEVTVDINSGHDNGNSVKFWLELAIRTGWLNNVSTTIHKAWVDFNRVDNEGPTITSDDNGLITFEDSLAGIYKIEDNGVDITNDQTINWGDDKKIATYQVTGGKHNFVVTDNVGNSNEYKFNMLEIDANGSYLLTSRDDFDFLSAYVAKGNDCAGKTYKIVPDTTIEGQDATTIAMGSSAFTPIGNSTTKFAGTLLGNGCTINGLVTNGQYSGLFGYVNNAHIENLTVDVSNDSDSTSAGGLVGVVNGTTTITNCNVSGAVKGTHQIGGFVGFAEGCVLTISSGTNSATITTTGQSSNDKGRTSGGGIVGYVNKNATVTINDVTNTGEVKTTSGNANSGLGGIVGFANGKTIINNCHNTASITGYAGLGGIVGYTANGSIVGCRNDGNITSSKAYNLGADSASYSGGIAGYCYADVAKCYNSGTVKTTSDWANSNQVAGIAAYLGSGRNVKYCYNEGQIEGSDYVGGIVGKRAGTVSYSYQAGKIKGLYKNTSTIGHITGSDNSKISTCWTLPGASNLTTVTNTFNHNGYTVNSEANVAMKPAFGNAVLGGWNAIISTGVTSGTFSEITGIDQFVFYPNNIEHEIENNKYLFVYDTSANAVALVPNHIDSGVSVITDTTTASVAKTVPFISRFFFNASSDKNLVASISPIDAPLTSTQTVYNGSGQKVTTDVVGADIQEKSYYFTSGNDNALAKSEFIDVGEYDIVTEVTMKVGENTYVVVGRQVRNNHWTIAQRKISFWNKVYYYGETPTNAPVPQSMSGDEGLLNGHIFTCTYANDLTYDFMYGAIPNAKKEVTINMTGEIRDAAGNDVTYNYDFQNGTFTISMREGNFGVKGTTDIVNNPWGSQGNPFVIKTAQHLVNLSKIVNGDTPNNADTSQIVNSIYNSNQYTHIVNNNTRTYKNCYFVIVKDIDMTGINFAPVGKSETYFFEGNVSGVKSIEDTTPQQRTISNLILNLESKDNVGLFGYAKGETNNKPYIKYIVLANTCLIKGRNNVGAIAGCAQDVIINNCENNAIVIGQDNVGGILGKNFGAQTEICTNNAVVTGVNNVGGIAGMLDWGVISNVQNSAMVEASGENCGGIVGYMISYSTLKDVTNNAQVNGGNKTGGVLGYYEKSTQYSVQPPIYDLTNNKPVEGLSNVGGIIGCVAGNLTFDGNNENQKCTMSGVSVKGTFNVGGLVGGVENNSTVTLTNFTNNANVIGGYVVGGLVGLLRGAITSSVNNADITSEYNKAGTPSGLSNGAYVGGIVGVAYGTISHCYNSGNISASGDNSDFLGGIVGYTNSNVSYCTSLANSSISGSNQVGGIAGKLQNATIDHCYFNGTIVGIWNNSGAKLDFICGEIIDGLVSNSWKLPNAQNGDTGNRTYTNAGNALTIATGMTFKPYFEQVGEWIDTEWEQIVSKNIVGFSVSGNVPTNSYFNSDNGNDTAYVKPDKTSGFAVNNTSGDVKVWYGADFGSDVRCSIVEIQIDTTADEYNGKQQGLTREDVHMPSANNGVYAVQFAYKGNQYGDVIPKDVDEYNTTVTVKIDEKVVGVRTDVKYKITKKKVTITNIWTWKFVNGSNADFYKFEYNKDIQGMLSITVDGVLENSHYTLTQANNQATVGKYSSSVVISDRDYEVEIVSKYCTIQNNNANLETDNAKYGIKTTQTNANTSNSQTTYTYNWEIVPFDLAANISNVWFGGRTDLIVGNQGIANVNVGNQSYADKRFYPLQSEQNGVQQVLVYAQHNYTAGDFVLYVKYNNNEVVELTRDTEYTVGTLDTITNTFGEFNVNVVSQANPVEYTNVTASGTGNFSGDITKYYTALYSDFGGNVTGANWGSADNPYVISKPEHLLRLSQIVNGGMAWNSIITTNNALCISPQGTAVATDRAYSGAYFLVTADINMSGYISTDGVYNFLPIGHRNEQSQTDMPFSGTFDGNSKQITYLYNTESFKKDGQMPIGARVDYVGLFGYLKGATVQNVNVTSNALVKGGNYVGLVAGYAKDSKLSNVFGRYGGTVEGTGNYVGGIVGYADNTWLKVGKDYDNAITNANVAGMQYVGGIVGKWIVRSEDQIGGDAAGQAKITLPSGQQIHGVKYVGGIAGWMDTSSCATTISYAPQLNNNGEKVGVYGTEYVGALFGVLIGNGYHQNATNDKYTAIVIDKDASDNFKVGNATVELSGNAKVVGGLVGYAESVGILFNTDWTTSNVTLDTGNYTPSFIGGIAGVLGKNATIEAIYQLKDDGTFLSGGSHTITHSVPDEQTFGTAAKPLGSFVGGIVGYVSSKAGTYWDSTTTIFGNGIALVNSANIYAKGYVGGIFGALGDLSTSVASSFESDTDSILYKVLTTGVREGSASTTLGLAPTVSGNGITAQGRLVNNASISVSGSYVGGIAGYGGAKVRFVLRNTPQDSAIDVSKLNIYSGGSDIFINGSYAGCSDIFINGSYAGGIAGYLVDNLEHDLQYIVVKAKFNQTNQTNQNATHVGGLVGYMGSGNVQNCVVINSGSRVITESTDTYKGKEYVGGLVGETQNATIRNSVSTGFNLEKTSNTKGGLLGYGVNPTIDSSWTFYIAKKRTNFAKNATPNGAYYAIVSQSPYGKYILVDEGLINATEASYPTFVSLCGFVGLLTNANVEGTLEFAVKVPNKTLNSNYENTQLAFYNASGSDTVTDNVDSFSKFENNNNTLTIALDMASGNSMQICVVGIEFVNVPQKNDTDTDKTTVVEGKYRKPSNSDKYIVHVTTANFNSERQITKIVATVYFECNGNLPVVIGSAYDDKRNIGGYDETFTPGSSTNPYTISSQEEWNDFAWSIYTGANDYEGKYVKLLKNITIEKKTEHKGTKVNHNFASVSTPNSYSEADPKNANSNMGYNFAGNISQGNSDMKLVTVDGVQGTTTPSFKGHFDGNGNKIKISVNENVGTDYYHRMSAFPNAGINASSKTTFKNLTIYGTIIAGDATAVWDKDDMPWTYNSAYDIAGFVGKPFGAIKFENCTAQVNIKGLRLIAGFAGGSTSTAPIELVGCVNKGDITSYQHSIWTTGTLGEAGYPKDFEYGTGGLIGYATNDITIDSCLNTGDITGETKVGGLVGRVTAKTTIINSANIGKVLAKELNPHYLKLSDNEDRNRKLPTNAWGRAGGIVGEASKTATLQMFACYNTGEIRTWSNVVGGLVGIVGTIPDDKKPHSAEANNKSTIAYCYNKGNIIAGYHQNLGNVDFGTSGINFNGTDAGGIVGVAVRLDINYCYNTGDVATYGLSTQVKSYQVRMGGILAEAATGDPKGVTGNGSNRTTKDQLDVCINDCYTTGTLHIEENHNTSNTSYGANIIGYLQGTNKQTSNLVQANRCYGVASSIKSYKDGKIVYYSGWNNAKGGDIQYVRTGTTLNSLSDLTAIMRSDGSVKPRAFYYANNQNNEVELWNASTSTIGAQNDANYKNGTLGGYVYVYGCLPQLAVFAVDTYNGLSMNSQNFGKDIYGEYKAQKAGEKYSPYVIRDGIDLMGVQTLVGLGYTFADKYIEFANGSNNITLDKNLSSDVAKAINMPTTNESNSGGQKIKDTDYAYMASSDGTTYNQIGKSYHLFKQGAVCKDDNNSTANNAYQTWVGRTYYYDGAYNYVNDWANNATFKVQNMLSIGRNGNVFKGSISGKQENNDNPDKPVNTVINNLRIMTGKTNGGAYAGLFGHIEDAYVGYIEVGGESNIWSFSYNNSDISVAGGVVAYMTGGSVVEHCVLSGTASVGAYGIDDKTNITTLSKPDFTYAGGIVGLADPKQGSEYKAGISAIIKGCTVNISTTTGDRAAFAGIIQACKSNIGGVLGYVGGDAGANGKGNSVRIERCEVQKAAIQAASSATESSHIGGVLGYGSEYVAAFITGCKVGNGADTVTIKGEHSLGGIAGGMSNAKGGYIDSCIVGANTTIERINQGGGNISENPKHGTAIGGLVGFTEDSTDTTSPLTTTFSGTSKFLGTINVTVGTTNQSSTSDAAISCIGGIVGDMGSGASFASGSDVTVGGTIDINNSQGDWLAAANVGGVVGRTNKATFIGKFNIAPNMSTENAENVGGFIGKNIGTVYILADTTDKLENTTVDALNGTNITIGGTIKGTSEVGGFIGVNNSGSTLNIGSNVANAKAYKSGTLSIIIAEGATISGSGNHVGGIVGKNEGVSGQDDYATIDIVKGTIVQNGTISGKNYVGGIIGLNAGLLTTGGGEADTTIGGVTLSEEQQNEIKNLSINNTGSVTGTGDYVGGVVGKLDSPSALRTEDSGKGAIAGTFTNSGKVVGNSFVGGSLGFVGKNVTITAKNNVATLFVNDGEVNATGYFVGGSIGALVGKIQGENSSVAVKFENKKKVNATGYVGGSIGVLAGSTKFAQFVNSSTQDFTIAACNSVGGSVGYIGMPDALKAVLNDYFQDDTYSDIDTTVQNVHFEANGNLTAEPTDATLDAAKKDANGNDVADNLWGGVGGSIGVLGKRLTKWKDNTYYANGNVIAQNVNNVGGIIGLINANDITIGNLLAYNITVTGAKNVGGIVGATDGIGTVITSAYAIEGTFTGSKNVGGIIGLAKTDTDASTSYWVKGYANSDIATYDVKDLSKLGFTTGKATTGWFFLYAKDATVANGLGTINTNHQGGGEIELKYWKRIANAYTAQERADGDDKKTIAPPSNIVSGGQPQHATLYATATAAEVTEKGYYMYTATSNNDVKPSVIYDNGVYYISVKTNVINAEDEKVQAQNVAVFYRSVSSSKEALIYNGYLRNAIIGLDGVYLYENPIGDNETPTINGYKGQYIFTATTTIKNADGSTSEVNEAQSDPNTYSSVIKIYYVDDNGTARLVGGNTELAWKITERELAVAFEHTTNRTYGTGTEDNTTDMTVTIDNIAPKRGVTVPIRIVVSYGTQEDSRVIFTWDGTKFNGADENIKLTSLPMTPSGTLSDKDKESTSETIEDEATYQLVVKLFFKQAKSYTITVLDSSQKARYTFKKNGGSASAEVSDEFTVLPAPLTLRRGDNVAASSAYDGTAKGTAWVVEGFKYNDGIQQFSEFAPSFNIAYKNSGAITKAMTAENMTTGVDFNGPRVTVSGPTGGDLTITLSSAIKKGDYYLSFGKYKAGNYVLTADDSVRSYSIVEIQITISCADNGKSKVYNGQTQTIEISFVASVPSGSGITDFEGIENFAAFISEFFNIKEGDFTVTKPSNTGGQKKEKEVKWTITTGKNAKEYKFEFEKGNKYNEHIQNCSHKPETLPTYKYTITRRPLTLTTTLTEMPNGASQYTYNTSHQGLSKIKVDNLVANDTIGVTIKIGTQSATVELENNNAKDVTDKVSTIDAGTYSVSFALSTNTSYPQNENYTLTATDVTWKIDKYKIMVGEFNIGANKTYNAKAEVPKINVTNSEVSGNGTTFNYGTDTFTLEYSVSYNGKPYAGNKLVNAGTYKINIGTSNGKIIAKHSDGTDASDNYEFGNSATEHPYVINPCPIEIVWNIKSYVYNASNQMLSISGIKIGENDTVVAVFSADKVKGLGNDTLTFNRSGGGTDVGSYTTKVTSHSVSGEPNHGVRPIAGNYKIVSGATSDKFSITPSKLEIFYAGGTTTKVYDAGLGISGTPFVFNTQSQNGGAHGTSELFDISYVYKDKNVGNDKEVVFTYVLKQNANYEYVGTGTESQNKGQITPAHIKVALDKLRSGKATRTFTNDEFYGGAEGATGNGRSKTYRTGEGFTVSGVLGSDNINVVARYQEADNTRNSNSGNYFDFSKYVNDVYKDADGTFKKASTPKYFKKLVFTMTGTDAANYTFNVYDSSAEGGNKYSESDSTAAAIQSVTVYDSRDSKNKNASGEASIQIEITVKSVRVEYSDTAQSYANDDNTYNTDWKPITGTNKDMDKADAKIKVSNGWMYVDGKDHTAEEGYTKREYRGYTTIRGSQNSERLGAKVDPTNGMDLNYRLSNQPTLTIAYFVSTGDEYEINSLARLLIASFYYTASQNPGNLEIIKIVSSGYKWVSVVSADDYDKGEFELPQDTPITDSKATTWDEYFTELEAKGYSVFLNIEANAQDNIPANTWGYYATTTSESSTIPTSYKLTKDIVGKFTESDISILNTFFTVIGDDGQTITSTWSGNGTYLKNVLKAAEGKIATINGSLFVSTAKTEEAGDVTGFGGTFDGNGYVIEYLNIMGYGKDNVGLFDVIGANGIVKNLHLRNVTINGNAKYVGGIAGKVLAAADALTEKSVKNVSFHGSINVTGSTDQSVGGLFGISERAVENAIVLGSITVSNANAKVGGVVGSSEQGMSNVVSMMQITASGGTVGAFTSNNAHVGENCTHMTNAVWKKGTSGTGFENVDGKNVGYNDLMSGSVSGYGTTNKYYHESETSVTKGEYDVLDDVVLTKISVDNKENARQSMRLADIVKVYLLMYSLNETQATDSGNLNGANVYAISTSSWLVGTADGTTAKPIAIANKQNVSLLRELRFASFTLKANVSIEIASTFSGAFYGSVTSATNESGTSYGYKIICDKAMFEAYSNETKAWLSVQ